MEDFDTSTFFQDVADLPLLVSEVGEKWKQPSLLKSTPTVTPSSKTTGPISPLPRVKIKLEGPHGRYTPAAKGAKVVVTSNCTIAKSRPAQAKNPMSSTTITMSLK